MTGRTKPTAIEAFESNMADAHHLVNLVAAFTNQRVRRMRAELRARVGDALGIGIRQRAELDCLESNDVFLVLKPGSRIGRDDFRDARPLLRQAIVAACAATETYLADKAMESVGPLLRSSDTLTRRLRALPLTLGELMLIDEEYTREAWGVRRYIVQPAVRQAASTAPNQVGVVLSMLGIDSPLARLDTARGVAKGNTEQTLKRITDRRNRIAHEADRKGRGRASLTMGEVDQELSALESIVNAIEQILRD